MVKKRRKKTKTKNPILKHKLSIGIILFIAFICFLLSLYSPEQPNDNEPSFKAAIVDQLSFNDKTKNETFVQTATDILVKGGYTVDYYRGEEVTVGFYKKLPRYDYDIILFRVHSALTDYENGFAGPPTGLFTSEEFTDSKYFWEEADLQIMKANFRYAEGEYFSISSSFIRKKGRYDNALIIMMGCDGLTCDDMAKAFIYKGARVYISWNGSVRVEHTDYATIHLLQNLILQKQTIRQAIENTNEIAGPDPVDGSILSYYPEERENYHIATNELMMSIAITHDSKENDPGG